LRGSTRRSPRCSAYAVFGPSRIMVLGPDSALTALIAAAVISKAAGDPTRAVALASMLAIFTGVLCVIAGLARGGFITDLLSKPVRVGYMNGIGLTVLVTQLPKLFGFSVSAADIAGGAAGFARGVVDGRTKPEALVIGATCLAIILLGRWLLPRAPAILVAVVGAIVVVTILGLAERISVVGPLPHGIPRPAIAAVRLADLHDLAVAAIGVAVVSFADMSVLSRTYAGRHGHRGRRES